MSDERPPDADSPSKRPRSRRRSSRNLRASWQDDDEWDELLDAAQETSSEEDRSK